MTLKEKIAAARAAGIDEDTIWSKVQASPEYKQARDGGLEDSDIQGKLGIKLTAASPAPQTTESKAPEPAAPAGPGLADSIGHGAAIVGSGLTKGAIEGSIGLPGTILTAEKKYLPDSVNNALKDPVLGTLVNGPLSLIENLTGKDVLPTGQSLEGHLNSLGLNAESRNGIEEQLDATSRGIGAAAATLPLGGAETLTTLASGAASGEGSYWGAKAAPPGWEDVGSIAGGLLGGLAGAGPIAQKVINSTIRKTLTGAEGGVSGATLGVDAAQSALDEAKAAHAKLQSAGTDLNLAHQQNLLNMDIEHQKLIKDTATNAESQIKAVTEPAQSAITAHADALGASDTPQAAGEILQSHAKDWVNGLDSKLSKIWEPVDANVLPQTEVGLPNLKSALDDMNSKAGTLEPLNRLLKPALPQQLSNSLTHVKDAAEMDIVPPATYQDARVLRTTLGKALTDPKILNSVGESNAKQLYGALTSDIRDALKPLGLHDAFDAANSASRSLYNFADQHISKIIANVEGVGNNTPEVVANRIANLGKNGGTMFSTLRAQMPQAVDDLASFMIRSGKWSKLAPEAKEGLVPDPAVRASLDSNHAALETGAAPIRAQASQTIDTNSERIAQIKQLQAQQKIDQGREISASTKGLVEHGERLKTAKEAQESAKAVLDALKESTSDGAKNAMGINALLKSQVAGEIGDLALQTVGEPAATLLKLAVRGAPLAKYGINALRRNPMVLREGARGAFVGADENNGRKANALAP